MSASAHQKKQPPTNRPENGPNALEVALTQLFHDLEPARRNRLVATLRPFTAVFAEADFRAGGGWQARSTASWYSGQHKPAMVQHGQSRLQRAAYMSHVLQQARDSSPTIMDRWARSSNINTVEMIGLHTDADGGLNVHIGRHLLREGAFVRVEKTPKDGFRGSENNLFIEANLPVAGQRTVTSSTPAFQRSGVAVPDMVTLVGQFLDAAKSPAAGLYADAIRTLAERARAEAEAKQTRLREEQEAERRRLYGTSYSGFASYRRPW